MIVCHCTGATDRDVRQAAAMSANDRIDAFQACGAGGCCGGCKDVVLEILRASSSGDRRSAPERPAARD